MGILLRRVIPQAIRDNCIGGMEYGCISRDIEIDLSGSEHLNTA
jgi:hypothetical protein